MKKIRIPDVLKLNYDKLYDICNNGKVLSEKDTLILAACGILRCKIENKEIKDLMMFTYVFITTQKSKFDIISKWYNISCKTTRKGPIPLKQMIRHPFTRKKCKNPVDLEKNNKRCKFLGGRVGAINKKKEIPDKGTINVQCLVFFFFIPQK